MADNAITVIPIYTDEAMELFDRADFILRAVASMSIDTRAFPFFKTQPVQIGGVQFLDMRKDHG